MKKILIPVIAVLVVALIAFNLFKSGTKAAEVETSEIAREDLVDVVSASGTLTPKSRVDVSANAMGRITRLAVAEGDRVEKGDFLLEIDPTEYTSAVRGLQAAVETARADLTLAEANAEKARLDLERARSLFDSGLSSEEQLQAAITGRDVQDAAVEAARARLRQAQANLSRAEHDLSKVTITAPMTGVVTRLNVEEGENAVMGTMNVAGTVLLQLADLSTMEAEVDVDETEIVRVALGQEVDVHVDAFPDSVFAGRVTEIGNSPIFSASGQNRQAVDFKVTITLDDEIPAVRPGLSAKADIRVAESDEALAAPIGAVVIREWPPREDGRRRGRGRARRARATAADDSLEVEREEKEGVFVVVDGEARFTLVTLGITGEDHFEILAGLEEGDEIVTGPYRVLRDLGHGDPVEAANGNDDRRRGGDE